MSPPRIGGFRIPTFSPEYLEKVIRPISLAYGASEHEAKTVASDEAPMAQLSIIGGTEPRGTRVAL
jgi:hypothetical protein